MSYVFDWESLKAEGERPPVQWVELWEANVQPDFAFTLLSLTRAPQTDLTLTTEGK